MKTLLINLDTMTILKLVTGKDAIRRCEYWADILIPKEEFYVCGELGRDLSRFTLLELQLLYNNGMNAKAVFKDYPRAIELVKTCIERFPESTETLGELVKKLGRPLKEQDFTPVKEKAEPKSQQNGLPPTRPKEGTMTARVWEAADWLYSQQVPQDSHCRSFRDAIIKVCVDNGVNASTAATQFSKWRKALNAS